MTYGLEGGDDKIDTVSLGSGELVSELIPVPPGLALENGNQHLICESLYVNTSTNYYIGTSNNS